MITNKLGFGLMRLPLCSTEQTDIDMEQFKKMVDLFLERGFTYFDTSYVYHNGESENAIRKALTERHDRNAYQLASKFPTFLNIQDGDKIEAVFQEQLDKCGVTYFDYYLLHSLKRDAVKQAEATGLFQCAKVWKANGKIHHLGLSWHDSAAELDKVLADHPEIEFVQIVINYYDWEEPIIQSKACYEVIRQHGCEVIAMEPIKGGMLAEVPAAAEERMKQLHPELSPAAWALRFAANLDGMITVLSGMSTLEQVEDNTASLRAFSSLDENERAAYAVVVEAYRGNWKIQCSDWEKMDAVAPNHVPISAIIRLYNSCLLQPNPAFTADLNYYYLFKDNYGCDDFESWDYASCTDALGGELDVNAAMKEATDFLLKYSFK